MIDLENNIEQFASPYFSVTIRILTIAYSTMPVVVSITTIKCALVEQLFCTSITKKLNANELYIYTIVDYLIKNRFLSMIDT